MAPRSLFWLCRWILSINKRMKIIRRLGFFLSRTWHARLAQYPTQGIKDEEKNEWNEVKDSDYRVLDKNKPHCHSCQHSGSVMAWLWTSAPPQSPHQKIKLVFPLNLQLPSSHRASPASSSSSALFLFNLISFFLRLSSC